MRVLICGQREYKNRSLMRMMMSILDFEKDTVIEGESRGADRMAKEIAREMGFPEDRILKFPADWNKFGKPAGPIRNQQMLDEGKPDEVWAFFMSREKAKESKGTADMVERAEKAEIPVYKYYSEGNLWE